MIYYTQGDEIRDGDICTSLNNPSFLHMATIKTAGDTILSHGIVTGRLVQLANLQTLPNDCLKHPDLMLLCRKEDVELLINTMVTKAKEKIKYYKDCKYVADIWMLNG